MELLAVIEGLRAFSLALEICPCIEGTPGSFANSTIIQALQIQKSLQHLGRPHYQM